MAYTVFYNSYIYTLFMRFYFFYFYFFSFLFIFPVYYNYTCSIFYTRNNFIYSILFRLITPMKSTFLFFNTYILPTNCVKYFFIIYIYIYINTLSLVKKHFPAVKNTYTCVYTAVIQSYIDIFFYYFF